MDISLVLYQPTAPRRHRQLLVGLSQKIRPLGAGGGGPTGKFNGISWDFDHQPWDLMGFHGILKLDTRDFAVTTNDLAWKTMGFEREEREIEQEK